MTPTTIITAIRTSKSPATRIRKERWIFGGKQETLYIGELHMHVWTDGSQAVDARFKTYTFSPLSAWRIRRAVRKWRAGK